MLSLFLANTRSVKGKATELTAMTLLNDIVCITETHIDNTFTDKQVIETDNNILYRQDRNIHGGGVLIAVNRKIKSTRIETIATCAEIIFVRIEKKYYNRVLL